MNQGQSKITWHRTTDRFGARNPVATRVRRRADRPFGSAFQDVEPPNSWAWGLTLVALFDSLWSLITLPFRLVFWAIAWLGRLTGAAMGFAFMVVGFALLAGPLYIIGIPLFFVGLVVTLRCLE
jgi:hypothetical protein